MRIILVPVLVAAFFAPTFAEVPPLGPDTPDAEWKRFGRGSRPEPGYVPALDDALAEILWAEARAHHPLDVTIDAVAGRFQLRRDTAADLVEATLIAHRFADVSSSASKDKAQVQRAASALWRAYRREPGADVVLQQAAWILSASDRDPIQERRMLDELELSTDPAPLVARFAWLGVCSDDTRRTALGIAIGRRADQPALLLAASGLSEDDPCVAAAWAREALSAAGAPAGVHATFLATARNRLLTGLLTAGLLREAMDALATIPTDAIDAALATSSTRVHGTIAGLEYEVPVTPLRAAAASAAFLVDELDLARQLAIAPKASAEADADLQRELDPVELARSAIDALSATDPADAFEVLERVMVDDDSWSHRRLLPSTLLFARLAHESNYPEIAADLLASEQHDVAEPDLAPARIAAQVQACRARSMQVRQDVARRLGIDTASSGAGDPGATLIARRLAAEPLRIYSEKPLPAEVVPWDPPAREREQLEKSLAKWKLPGLWPVRVDRAGATVIGIGLSQDYDPAGEVSGGGYWIVRSNDAGTTWGRPLYAGLRPMQPYVIRSFSHLALSSGDRLRIEVDVRELDTGKIRFPPIGRAFKRERSGLYLDVAWADLERDSDEDGLTDLAEERLMTDPLAPDSDGDGLADGADPLPHIRPSGGPSTRAAALAAVLRDGVDKSARPIFTGDPGGQGPASPGFEGMHTQDPPLTSETTTFLVADRQSFAGLALGLRTIVLSRAEAETARERFGPHYPGSLKLYVDHAGTRGIAIWNESWRGMTLRLRNVGGVWRTTTMSSWIT